MVSVRGRIRSRPWPAEHHGPTREPSRQAVLPRVIDQLLARLGGRDLGVEPLATDWSWIGAWLTGRHRRGDAYEDGMHTLCTNGNTLWMRGERGESNGLGRTRSVAKCPRGGRPRARLNICR